MTSPELSVFPVSQRNRSFLFRDAVRECGRDIKKSRLLLAQLQLFRLDFSKDLKIKDSRRLCAPFRLLCEHTTRKQKSPSRTFESFVALSYCWHDKDWVTHRRLGRGSSPWPISQRMFYGLLDERESPDEGIWIDASCIEQRDEVEKRHAISNMDLVYRSARKVVAVLEDIAISDYEETLLQSLLNEQDRSFSDLEEIEKRTATLLLIRILSARWFQRAWCSHELQLARDLILLIPTPRGIYRMPRDWVEELYSMTTDFMYTQEDLRSLYVFRSYDFLTRSMECSENKVTCSPMCQFSDNMDLPCSIESDKIGISFNIVGLQLSFWGPKKSRDECRWILAMVALLSGDPTVLCGVEEPLVFKDPQSLRPTQSWLRWYDSNEDPFMAFGGSKMDELPCILAIKFEAIKLKMLGLQLLSLREPESLSKQHADKFVREYLNMCEDNNRTTRMYAEDRHSVVEILACSRDCGLLWIIRQMLYPETVANKMQRELEDLEFDLWPAVRDVFLVSTNDNLALDDDFPQKLKFSVLQYVLFVLEFGSILFEGTSSNNSTLSPNLEPYRSQSLVWESGDMDKAILLRGSVDLGPSSKVRKTVVPFALNDWCCTALRRLWILERVDSARNVWQIIDKLVLFTFQPILGYESIQMDDNTIMG